MRIPAFCHRTIPLLLTLWFASSLCYAEQKSVQAIGTTECADCQQKNIKHSDAFRGLKVSIDCKLANGEMKRRGEGKLNEEGKFSVDIPHELVEDGKKLKEECFAQLHSASNLPCAAHNGLDSTKLAFVSETNGKHTFSPVGKLKFSPSTCTSEFLWPFFKHPWFKKPWFKKPFVPKYKKPFDKPVYKKTITYTPSVPVYKKPFYKPEYKKPIAYTPSVHVYKKPFPKIDPKVFIHPKFKKWPFFPPKP